MGNLLKLQSGNYISPAGGGVLILSEDFAKASDPDPEHEETDVLIDQVLSWSGNGFPDSFDVYFGTSSPPSFVQNQAGESYDPPGDLDYNQKYYWRLDSLKIGEDTITGDEWEFTTIAGGLKKPMMFIVV